jgi:cytochrome d ubiquinol oxidase subunit II
MALAVLTAGSLIASLFARPDALTNYKAYPALFAIPGIVALTLAGIIYFARKEEDKKAFLSSCLYLAFMLVGAAAALYPTLLPSSADRALDITVDKAMSGPHTLAIGLIWWAFGMCLAAVYFTVVYRMFRGKVALEEGGYGH